MSLAKHIFGVGAWTGVSRILGFVRDMLIGQFLGAGRLSDIFLTAFKIPNLFRDLLGEGALSSVFIPMFAREKKSPDFASQVFSWLALIMLIITIMMIIFMPIVMMGLAPGFDAEKLTMTIYIARIMAGWIFLVCMVAFLAAILNAFSEFLWVAIMPIISNVFLIGALLVFGANLPILASAFLVIGVVQIGILWRRLKKRGFGLTLVRPRMNPAVKNMMKRMGWGFVGSGFYQLNVIVGVLIASFHTGAVSFLYFADRMIQLPFAMVALATGTVILTKISDAMRAEKMSAVYKYQNAAMRQSLMLILPCVAGLIALGAPIIRVLFEHGAWTADATESVALVIAVLALALPFMTTSQIYLKTLYASGDVKTPVKISAITLALAVVVMLSLSGTLEYLAVPVGTVVGGFVRNIWMRTVCARRSLLKTSPETVFSVFCFAALSALMFAALLFTGDMAMGVFSLGLMIALSAVIYLPLAIFCDKIIDKK